MAYDSKRAVTVLFGGYYISPDGWDEEVFGDTWEWDGDAWTKVASDGPGASMFNSMAYDAGRGVTVLYGATPTGDETWEWDGSAWFRRGTEGAPGPRAAAAMVYDAGLHACILFGGYSGNHPQNDTWAWDGHTWTKLSTPGAPGPRADHAMAYDSARDAIVLFGGETYGHQLLDDTWEFTCTPPCYPDFDFDGDLTLFDFLAFVNAFNAGETGPADCDHNQSLDLFDFLCFVNAFNKGC